VFSINYPVLLKSYTGIIPGELTKYTKFYEKALVPLEWIRDQIRDQKL